MSPSTTGSRSLPARAITALCVLGGLLLGLVLAIGVGSTSQASYSAATNYAILPGTKATASDLGQVGFLTPVFAGRANDPQTKAKVKELIGREPAGVISTTFPDSELLFSLTATGTDPKLVIDTLNGYEKTLMQMAAKGDPVPATNARLSVASHATQPSAPDSMSPKVIYLAGAVAGALVGLAAALGLARRRRDKATVTVD